MQKLKGIKKIDAGKIDAIKEMDEDRFVAYKILSGVVVFVNVFCVIFCIVSEQLF